MRSQRHQPPLERLFYGALEMLLRALNPRPGTGTSASVYLYEATDLPGCERVLLTTQYSPAELHRSMPGTSDGTTGRGSWLISTLHLVPEPTRCANAP